MEILVFNNADAKPKTVKIECYLESVPHIMAWYGAYFAGDRYTVALISSRLSSTTQEASLSGRKACLSMTDRKTLQRERNGAGYEHVAGWTTTEDAPAIQERLLTAEEVDRKVSESKERDDAR